MWAACYLASLPALQVTLVKVGPSTQLERISLMDDPIDAWETSYALDLVSDVSMTLENLVEGGFLSFLSWLPGLRRELKSVLSWTCPHCKDSRTTELIEATLPSIFRQLCFLAPIKVHNILQHLNSFLEEEEEEDNCLDHLRKIHEDLEQVQPGRVLESLQDLHQQLASQQVHLKLLAPRECVKKKLGFPNLFHKLLYVRHTLSTLLKEFRSSLLQLEDSLEQLSQIQAVAPSSGDWEE